MVGVVVGFGVFDAFVVEVVVFGAVGIIGLAVVVIRFVVGIPFVIAGPPEGQVRVRTRPSRPVLSAVFDSAGAVAGTVPGTFEGTVAGIVADAVAGTVTETVARTVPGTVAATFTGTVDFSTTGTAAEL